MIDYFFIVDGDGDGNMHLIPSRAIAGRVGLGPRTCRKYIVGNAGGLLADDALAERAAGVARESA